MAKRAVQIVLEANDQASRKIKELGGEFKDVGREAEQASKGLDVFGGALTAAAIVGAGKAVYELGELGAQAIRTGTAFENISGGAEEAEANLEAMKRATRGAVSETEMMAQASRYLQMGLATNSDELANMTEMAVRLGTSMGRDASASMEEFALLLSNMSIPRLDTFGISASNVRTRITELMKANKALTREQAFLQAVQEEGTKAMARLGDSVEDEALAFERAEAKVADLRIELAERLAPAVSQVIDAGMQLLTWNEEMQGILADHAGDVAGTADSYADYREELKRAANMSGYLVDEQGRLLTLQGLVVKENYVLSESAWDAARGEQELAQMFEEMRSNLSDMPAALRGVSRSVEETARTSKTFLEQLSSAGEWAKAIYNYEDYQDARIAATEKAEQEIAEIERQFADTRYAYQEADEMQLLELQVNYGKDRQRFIGAMTYGGTAEARRLAELQLAEYETGYAEQLAAAQGHYVMVEGVTRTEADKRIAAIREKLDEELGTMSESWKEQRGELRKHFAEVQVAYLENQLATEDLSKTQRDKLEAAMKDLQLQFGLVTPEALALSEAEETLQKSLDRMNYDQWVDALDRFQQATEDNKISGVELQRILRIVDDEVADRFLDLFPQAAEELGILTEEATLSGDAIFEMGEEEILALEKTGQLQESVHVLSEKMGGAAGYAKNLRTELEKIPNEVYVDIYVRGHGVSPTGGGAQQYQYGTSYVPQTGLAFLHRGEAVLSAPEAEAYRQGGATTNMGNVNINISGVTDPTAVAAAVERRLQDRGIIPRVGLR